MHRFYCYYFDMLGQHIYTFEMPLERDSSSVYSTFDTQSWEPITAIQQRREKKWKEEHNA